MKIVDLKKRLRPNRRSEAVSVTIPDDVMADLERVRTYLGFSNTESLIRAYIGQGLRCDLERLEAEAASTRSRTPQLSASKPRRG